MTTLPMLTIICRHESALNPGTNAPIPVEGDPSSLLQALTDALHRAFGKLFIKFAIIHPRTTTCQVEFDGTVDEMQITFVIESCGFQIDPVHTTR